MSRVINMRSILAGSFALLIIFLGANLWQNAHNSNKELAVAKEYIRVLEQKIKNDNEKYARLETKYNDLDSEYRNLLIYLFEIGVTPPADAFPNATAPGIPRATTGATSGRSTSRSETRRDTTIIKRRPNGSASQGSGSNSSGGNSNNKNDNDNSSNNNGVEVPDVKLPDPIKEVEKVQKQVEGTADRTIKDTQDTVKDVTDMVPKLQ